MDLHCTPLEDIFPKESSIFSQGADFRPSTAFYKMTQVRYTVTASMANQEILVEYIAWLKAGHAQALIDAGALSAEVNVIDTEVSESVKAEATYVFPSQESLQAYMDGPALALREDGKTRWIDTGKISFTRRIAKINFVL